MAEPRRSCMRFVPLISYQSRFRLIWDVCMLALALWIAFSVPFHAAFLTDMSSNWEDYILVTSLITDIAFLLDVGFNFITTYPDKLTGDEVIEWKKIAKRYVFRWQFVLDVVASIPWSFIDMASPGQSKSAAILRLIRLLRLSALLTKMKAKETFKNTVRFLQILLLFVLITHWTACIFRAVVGANDDTWISSRDLIYKGNIFEETAVNLYYYFVFYSSLMVQTGGDMLPYTLSETVTVTILELASLILSTLLYSDMLVIIGRANERTGRVNEKLDVLHSMYGYLNLPDSLVKQIDLYAMKAEYSYLDVEQQSKFLSSLPPSIYTEVTKWMLIDILDATASLRELDKVNMDKLVRCLKSAISTPEETLFQQGQKGESTYFLTNGKLDLLFVNEQEPEVFEHVKIGMHFGFCSMLTASKRYSYSARGLVYCSYSFISNEDLLNVISSERTVFNELRKEEMRRHEGLRGMVLSIITQIPYLQMLRDNEEGLFQLQTLLRIQTYTEHEVLVSKGQKNTCIFYIMSGSLILTFPRKGGKMKMEEMQAGSVFGLFSIFSETLLPYSLQVESKSACVVMLDVTDLRLLATFVPALKPAKAIYEKLKRDDYIRNTMYVPHSEFEERQSLQAKIRYKKIVKVHVDSPRSLFHRILLRLLRGVYKKEVDAILGIEEMSQPKSFEKQKLPKITESHQETLKKLLEQQEKLIVSVIVLETQLAALRKSQGRKT